MLQPLMVGRGAKLECLSRSRAVAGGLYFSAASDALPPFWMRRKVGTPDGRKLGMTGRS